MSRASAIGRLLSWLGAAAAWLALLGTAVPALDPLASFLPIFGAAALLGGALAWRRGLRTLAWTAAALVPVALATAPEFLREIPSAAPGTPRIRILTHNVWVDNRDPAGTAQAIVDARPDVVLLQEADGSFRPMVAALRQHFPHATDCPGRCELAILSRWPILARGYFLEDGRGRKFGPPLLWARVAVPGAAPVTVATAHYPRPTSPEHARRRAAMAAALSGIERTDLVVAGDMNLTPWTSAMRAQDASFRPLVRLTRALASWPRPLPLLPIDQLYAGPGWGLAEARRLPATGSDHYPLLVTLGRR